ncbi:MAG: type I methionyl aminopeptidase [Actinobacteria bacterium]|nr:type I methionyl aminopeptidase [Actinomycetota bacterium]
MIIRKSPAEIELIAEAGKVLRACLDMLAEAAQPGVTTKELDRLAESFIRSRGGVPTFKGYRGFPASICASPNDMVVHGIPGVTKLKNGDILGIDVGVTLKDYVADAAVSVGIGAVTDEAQALMDVTQRSLELAIEQCRVDNRVGDISHAVQSYAEAHGYSVVRTLVGHGVGREMHEDPQVPNFGPPGHGPRLLEGMVLAIEPMINMGGPDVEVGPDNWAVYTVDGSLSAHFEHTVAITADGPRVLTVC